MAALSAPRKESKPVTYTIREYKMAADAVIYPGGIVCLSSGYAVAGSTATGLKTKGIACQHPKGLTKYDNTGGANGAISVLVQTSEAGAAGKQAFWLDNAGSSDAVAQANVGGRCYVYSDHEVTKTATGRSEAGEVLAVDATLGVLVRFDD